MSGSPAHTPETPKERKDKAYRECDNSNLLHVYCQGSRHSKLYNITKDIGPALIGIIAFIMSIFVLCNSDKSFKLQNRAYLFIQDINQRVSQCEFSQDSLI